MSALQPGVTAPAIHLQASDGSPFSLKDYRNSKNVVLYFYPKDDTPGCTTEACGFRDINAEILKQEAIVIGVSPDNQAKHQKFINKFQLPFLLLCDESKRTCTDYGVWVEKSMYGRQYMGVARTTFIIDKKGLLVKIFNKVKPNGHEAEVLAFLQTL